MNKIPVVVLMSLHLTCGFAATRYWTGAAGDNLWCNPNNWSGNTKPSYTDTAVFTNDVPLSIDFATYTDKGYTGDVIARVWDFQGKDVYFFAASTKNFQVHGGAGTDPQIKVVEGTTVTISNNVYQYNKGAVTKLGKGIVRQVCVSTSAKRGINNVSKLRIAEGTWDMMLADGLFYGCECKCTNVVIDTGASMYLRGYNATDPTATWCVDGELYLDTRWGSDTISALLGRGKVLPISGAENHTKMIVTKSLQPGGEGTVGELTVECDLDVSGARFYVEDDGTAMDKFTFSKALDLSKLAGLTYKVIGTKRSDDKQIVFQAASVSNEFADFIKEGPGADCAVLKYAAKTVVINPRSKGIVLFVR